jgi:ferritin
MIDLKIEKAINEQINAELYSSYLYLGMAAYFDGINLSGFAHWMKAQAKEEISHAMKFYDFIYARGGKVELGAIEKPSSDFSGALDIAERTLAHEQKVTGMINKLYELALGERDYAFQSLLKWFIDEQVEEEESATKLIERVKLVGEKGPNLLMLDKELGAR